MLPNEGLPAAQDVRSDVATKHQTARPGSPSAAKTGTCAGRLLKIPDQAGSDQRPIEATTLRPSATKNTPWQRPLATKCVVELVGLEPTTRRLWAAAMSDQLTLSNTRHSKLEDFRTACWSVLKQAAPRTTWQPS